MQSDDEHSYPVVSQNSSRIRGWAGEEMELAHQREKIKEQQESSRRVNGVNELEETGEEQYSTVNLEQFRNRKVGVGYQARGVMRQKSGLASTGSMKIVDMTKKRHRNDIGMESTSSVVSSSERKSHKKKHKHNRNSSRKKTRTRDQSSSSKEADSIGDENIQKYLQCKGIIDFRKELHKILSEASKSKSL